MSCKKPCPQCPFARATPKEYLDTKGENGHRFIGQSIGPYDLPCHMPQDFENWPINFALGLEYKGCVGARIFRANIGVSHFLPEQLTGGEFEVDFETVFGGHDELLAHHRGISIEEAREILKETPPIKMLFDEMSSMGGLVKPVSP